MLCSCSTIEHCRPSGYVTPLQTAKQKQHAGLAGLISTGFCSIFALTEMKGKNKNVAHLGIQWIWLSFTLRVTHYIALLFSPPQYFSISSPGFLVLHGVEGSCMLLYTELTENSVYVLHVLCSNAFYHSVRNFCPFTDPVMWLLLVIIIPVILGVYFKGLSICNEGLNK